MISLIQKCVLICWIWISSTAKIVLYNKYSVKKEINFKLKKTSKNRHSGEMLAAEKHKRTYLCRWNNTVELNLRVSSKRLKIKLNFYSLWYLLSGW